MSLALSRYPTVRVPAVYFCGGIVAIHIHTPLCLKKNIPNIFDCNLKTNYRILIIFGTNIPDATCYQTTIQFSTSPNFYFCTTWRKHNQ